MLAPLAAQPRIRARRYPPGSRDIPGGNHVSSIRVAERQVAKDPTPPRLWHRGVKLKVCPYIGPSRNGTKALHDIVLSSAEVVVYFDILGEDLVVDLVGVGIRDV
jgi:hypothetical protein